MDQQAPTTADLLDPDEIKIAKILLHNKKISKEQFDSFIAVRRKFDQEGKPALGDVLVDLKYITQDDVNEFLLETNDYYFDFCKLLVEEGFLTRQQMEAIENHKDVKKNVVSTVVELDIMTRKNFIILFSKRVNSLRLGDWLLTHKRIDTDQLKAGLKKQKIYRLDDYLVYKKIVSVDVIKKIKEKLNLA